MDKQHPIRLLKDPIFECVIELQFEPGNLPVAEGLPGKLFESLKGDYPKFTRTPESQIPSEIRERDLRLRYQALARLVGPSGNIGIADRAVQVVFGHPYPGWGVVKPTATRVLSEVLGSEYLDSVSRMSIKYQNLVPATEAEGLSPLEISLDVGRGIATRNAGKLVRVEIEDDFTTTIVQIQPSARVATNVDGGEKLIGTGILLALDTITFDSFQSDALEESLDRVHDAEKAIFFRLLTPETLEKFDPVWE